MAIGAWPPGRVVELTEQDCWDFLATQQVGRVAWCDRSPHLVPVNYVVAGASVRIRTTAYSELGRQARDKDVAFEVDDLDAFTRSGVSVVLAGRARPWSPEAARAGADAPELESWAAGQRSLVLSIEPGTVSGRRVLPS